MSFGSPIVQGYIVPHYSIARISRAFPKVRWTERFPSALFDWLCSLFLSLSHFSFVTFFWFLFFCIESEKKFFGESFLFFIIFFVSFVSLLILTSVAFSMRKKRRKKVYDFDDWESKTWHRERKKKWCSDVGWRNGLAPFRQSAREARKRKVKEKKGEMAERNEGQ